MNEKISQSRKAFKTTMQVSVAALGGVHAVSALLNTAQSTVSEYQTPHTSKVIPIHLASLMDRHTEEAFFLNELASQSNHVVMPIVPVQGNISLNVGRLTQKASDLVCNAFAAQADGKYTIEEFDTMLNDLQCLEQIMRQARSNVAYAKRRMMQLGMHSLPVHEEGAL